MRMTCIGGIQQWRREFPEYFRDCLMLIARTWKETFLPLHFRPGASQRYGYDPRDPKKARKAVRMAGRTVPYGAVDADAALPLIWTGNLRRAALGPAALTGRASKAVLSINATNVVFLPGKTHSRRPGYMVDEITRVTPEELSTLSTMAAAFMADRMNAAQDVVSMDYD